MSPQVRERLTQAAKGPALRSRARERLTRARPVKSFIEKKQLEQDVTQT